MSETKSTHRVEVVPLKLERHPNADKLSVARVYGFSAVTGTAQWEGATLAAFVPDDTLVPVDHPAFAFLAPKAKYEDGTMARIKPIKLRGVQSMGLLVPAPPGSQVGDDVAHHYGVKRYEPPVRGTNGPAGGLFSGGETASPPEGSPSFKYDLEAGRRYAAEVFTPGEECVYTEKTHGANAKFLFAGGRMHCGSRTEWKKEYPSYDHVKEADLVAGLLAKNKRSEGRPGWEPLAEEAAAERARAIIAKLNSEPKVRNMWWQALDATPGLRMFCEANPGVTVFGEVYGAVQDLPYGFKKGEVAFAAFDLWKDGRFLDYDDARRLTEGFPLPWVPVLARTGFDFELACTLAEGPSTYPGADHVREGCVVKPVRERWDERVGRVALKWVGNGYLERSPDPQD